METVTHHGRTTAYRAADRGATGPTLLCVHGSGATHELWKAQFRLADEYPVVALDLSGHGDSEDVSAEPGYETLSAYVDDLLAVRDATDADVLVGNSLGGAVVVHALLERSIRPAGVVLSGTGAKLAVLSDLREWLEDDFERALSFLHAPGRFFVDPDDEVRTASMETMRATGREVTRRDFLSCHTFDVRDRLEEIHVPALAVVGRADKLTPPEYHEFLAERLRACDLAVIEDAAHLAMLERPGAFNAALEEFLAREVVDD